MPDIIFYDQCAVSKIGESLEGPQWELSDSLINELNLPLDDHCDNFSHQPSWFSQTNKERSRVKVMSPCSLDL